MRSRNDRPIIPVILAGGSGTRLWPISTPSYPKQFLALFDEYSFLQKTVQRIANIANVLDPVIVCGQQHLSLVQSHLSQISVKPLSIIIEPLGKNTAPATALAAIQQVELLEDPILLILPSDHIISGHKKFQQAIKKAACYAEEGQLVTFGIVPDRPDVNYGYMKVESALNSESSAYQVKRFIEKPSLAKAEQYLYGGEYHWNSGMFMFRASVFLKELSTFEPEIFNCCQLIKPALFLKASEKVFSIPLSTFQACPKKSIDYAVMEKTQKAVMMPLNIEWSDIGSWYALWRYHQKDTNGNAIWGNVDLFEVQNSLIYAQDKSVSLRGVKNRIVVHVNNEVFQSDLYHEPLLPSDEK